MLGADPPPSSSYWEISVAIAVGANVLSNLGINVQKLALTKKAQRKPMGVVAPLWILGFAGIVGGALGDFAALGFGAQSIVAPLGSLNLVANVVVAPLLLGEKPTWKDLVSTATIVAGCAVAVAFASHEDRLYSLDELLQFYSEPRFYAYFTPVVVVVLVWLLVIRWIERVQATRGSRSPEYMRVFRCHRFSYAAISGIAGAQSVLFAKTCVETLTDAIQGGGLVFLRTFAFYAILAGMTVTITLQIYWLNCGLARWDALYNVPVFTSFWILMSVVSGGIFYGEFSTFSTLEAIFFPLGVVLTIIGVYFLSQREAESLARARGMSATMDGSGDLLWDNTSGLLEARPELVAQAKATIKNVGVVFRESYLGLGLVRIRVKLVDVVNPHHSRVVRAWAVQSFLPGVGGGLEALDSTVQPGDLLVAVNGESLLDRWLSHSDAVRRITNTARPVELTFRTLTAAQRRRVLRAPEYGEGTRSSSARRARTSGPSERVATPSDLESAPLLPDPVTPGAASDVGVAIELVSGPSTEDSHRTAGGASAAARRAAEDDASGLSSKAEAARALQFSPASAPAGGVATASGASTGPVRSITASQAASRRARGTSAASAASVASSRGDAGSSTAVVVSHAGAGVGSAPSGPSGPRMRPRVEVEPEISASAARIGLTLTLHEDTPSAGVSSASAGEGMHAGDGENAPGASRMSRLFSAVARGARQATARFGRVDGYQEITADSEPDMQLRDHRVAAGAADADDDNDNDDDDDNSSTAGSSEGSGLATDPVFLSKSTGVVDGIPSAGSDVPLSPAAVATASLLAATAERGSGPGGAHVPRKLMAVVPTSKTSAASGVGSLGPLQSSTRRGTASHSATTDAAAAALVVTPRRSRAGSRGVIDEGDADPDAGLIDGWGREGGSTGGATRVSYSSASGGATSVTDRAAVVRARHESGGDEVGDSDLGESYVIAVYVDEETEATSPAARIRTAHHQLQNMHMDPIAGIFHMGGLVGPSAIYGRQDAPETDPQAAHPLAALVDRMFPHEGEQWRFLDRWLERIGARRGTDADAEESSAHGTSTSTVAADAAAGSARPSFGLPWRTRGTDEEEGQPLLGSRPQVLASSRPASATGSPRIPAAPGPGSRKNSEVELGAGSAPASRRTTRSKGLVPAVAPSGESPPVDLAKRLGEPSPAISSPAFEPLVTSAEADREPVDGDSVRSSFATDLESDADLPLGGVSSIGRDARSLQAATGVSSPPPTASSPSPRGSSRRRNRGGAGGSLISPSGRAPASGLGLRSAELEGMQHEAELAGWATRAAQAAAASVMRQDAAAAWAADAVRRVGASPVIAERVARAATAAAAAQAQSVVSGIAAVSAAAAAAVASAALPKTPSGYALRELSRAPLSADGSDLLRSQSAAAAPRRHGGVHELDPPVAVSPTALAAEAVVDAASRRTRRKQAAIVAARRRASVHDRPVDASPLASAPAEPSSMLAAVSSTVKTPIALSVGDLHGRADGASLGPSVPPTPIARALSVLSAATSSSSGAKLPVEAAPAGLSSSESITTHQAARAATFLRIEAYGDAACVRHDRAWSDDWSRDSAAAVRALTHA